MRQSRSHGTVGAWGGQPPWATRTHMRRKRKSRLPKTAPDHSDAGQPLMPVVTMPWMKRFWAMKKMMNAGRVTSTLPAITVCSSSRM